MESLVENHLYADVMHLNNHKTSTLTPELQFLPFLAKSFLQENHSLTIRPPSLFPHMPALRVLDLSHTMIQSLPPSISKLSSLEQFFLRDCSLLIEIPPEIGALKNLKLFDLEGTEIMYIPKEIGKLGSLECLRVSLSAYADDHKDSKGIQNIVPRMTIMKLTKLKELSISVSPEAEWWEAELLETIMEDLLFLPDLKTLKLYLPTAKALQQFLRLERNKVPIYSSLWNYRFMTGHCEQLPFSVQLDTEESFLKLEKCVKYMNGEGCSDEMMELVRDARALYLRRHWTIENLSRFDLRRLKYCLLMECNEMQTLVDQEDSYKHKNKSTSQSEDDRLGSLQYLSVHFLKRLQRISKGPIGRNSLSCLRILALHTCPELTSIFTECLLNNLQSLTEIIVVDCPKVNCLVDLEEGAPSSNGTFLPNLRRVSLLHLPELVSVSGGVCIAPQLDTLLVFNCMKLDYLSYTEIPRATMAIKGEIEWWDALKYGKSTWENVFVQLKRDESLMDLLAEDTNSLKHFVELKMVPSPACYRRKHKMEVSRRIEVKETPDHDGYIWRKYGQKDILGSKYPRSYYRCTFRNTHACCATKQVQRRCTEEPCVFEVVYRGKHTCPEILSSTLQVNQSSSKDTKEDREHVDQLQVVQKEDLSNESKKTSTLKIFNCNNGTRSQYAETAFRMWEPPSPIGDKPDNKDTQCMFKAPNQKLASTKKKSSSADIAESIQQMKRAPHGVRKCLQNGSLKSKYSSIITSSHQVKVNKGIQVEEALDDGYIWRKYGEKSVCGSKYPRAYYRCSTRGCSAKKHVHRSTEDPSVFEVSYGGKHTCHTVLSNIHSSTATESTCATFRTRDSSTATKSVSVNIDSHFGVSKIPQVLDSNKKMSGGAGIQRWKQQTKEIQFPSLKSQLPSSYEQNVKKETMGDRVTELQQLFSPFGKGRVIPVLSPACQPSAYGVNNLGPPFSSHYCPSVPSTGPISNQTESVFPARPNEPVCQYYMTTGDCKFGASCKYDHPPDWAVSDDVLSPIGLPMRPDPKQDLRKQGLCLVPVSSTFPFTNPPTTDFSSHTFGEPPNESDAYKA